MLWYKRLFMSTRQVSIWPTLSEDATFVAEAVPERQATELEVPQPCWLSETPRGFKEELQTARPPQCSPSLLTDIWGLPPRRITRCLSPAKGPRVSLREEMWFAYISVFTVKVHLRESTCINFTTIWLFSTRSYLLTFTHGWSYEKCQVWGI